MNTDRWYYRVFQSAPDLIRALLPGSAPAADVLGLDPNEPGDRLYRFEALEIKELSHRLDGVLWPRWCSWKCRCTRIRASTTAWRHWSVVVITPHSRLNLLTLPIRPERDLAASSQLLMQRLPHLTNEEIMVIAGIPLDELRHTRAAQEWLAEGRQEGRRDEAAAMTLRLLNRRCGPLS